MNRLWRQRKLIVKTQLSIENRLNEKVINSCVLISNITNKYVVCRAEQEGNDPIKFRAQGQRIICLKSIMRQYYGGKCQNIATDRQGPAACFEVCEVHSFFL